MDTPPLDLELSAIPVEELIHPNETGRSKLAEGSASAGHSSLGRRWLPGAADNLQPRRLPTPSRAVQDFAPQPLRRRPHGSPRVNRLAADCGIFSSSLSFTQPVRWAESGSARAGLHRPTPRQTRSRRARPLPPGSETP
jgi:hypothetical protein